MIIFDIKEFYFHPTNNKSFLENLKKMYKETNLWGSVTVTIKRSFPETFTFAPPETEAPTENQPETVVALKGK